MNGRQQFIEERGPVSRMEYEDGTTVLVADVGPGRRATVDPVDGTVIVVVDGEQYEFEVRDLDEEARAFVRNGVLTVEVDR